ncbi:MAG: hypothetical protein HY906_00645 [Deltaproteobacteria bacterium]|nr:hypothetical protein [Deltaproteobacteria bacterium]
MDRAVQASGDEGRERIHAALAPHAATLAALLQDAAAAPGVQSADA